MVHSQRRRHTYHRLSRAGLRTLALCIVFAQAGCRDEPPRAIAGFGLGMSQDRVLEEVRGRGGFTCTLRGTVPPLTICEGPEEDGAIRVVVRQYSTIEVTRRMDPRARNPRRDMQRFVRRFGEPAWRERPYPTRSAPLEGYHTLWLDRDSTRAFALVCQGRRLTPPCTAELTLTSPTLVSATLDSLLEIRR